MFRRMTRERYLSDDELRAFMAAVRGRRHVHQPRDLALFALLANTGLRPSEVRALTRRDCHLGPDPWVRVVRLKKKKAVKEIDDLPISAAAAMALAAYMAESPEIPDAPVFRLSRRQMHRLFKFYAADAEIRPLSLYSLRHTAATRLYRETRNINLVQSVLGHEKPDMTALYAHVPRSMLVELARSFPPII